MRRAGRGSILNGVSPYKVCPSCKKTWDDPLDLIRDRSLRLNGYQAVVPDSTDGLLLLTHEAAGCRSTLAVFVRDFRFLYDGPAYGVCLQGEPSCEEHCQLQKDLSLCDAHCSMHWAREVLQCFLTHQVPAHVL
jgi:hypothetical protein